MKPTTLLLAGLVLGTVVCGCGKRISRDPEIAFKELTHLATLKCDCTFVNDSIRTNKWRTDDKVLCLSWGSVLLSFDLEKVTSRWQGNTLVLTLPELEASSPSVDKFEPYDVEQSFLTTTKEIGDMKVDIKRKSQKQLVSLKDNPSCVHAAKEQAEALIRAFYASQFPNLNVRVELSQPLGPVNREAFQQ